MSYFPERFRRLLFQVPHHCETWYQILRRDDQRSNTVVLARVFRLAKTNYLV